MDDSLYVALMPVFVGGLQPEALVGGSNSAQEVYQTYTKNIYQQKYNLKGEAKCLDQYENVLLDAT